MRRLLFKNLISRPVTERVTDTATPPASFDALGEATRGIIMQRLGRSLSIREVDAGSCNGCELEVNALNNPFYDLERFGIRFVASPRHADMLLVTGPVTKNMREALERTYAAMPGPKWVIAAGDCAAGCGVFEGSYACVGAVGNVVPVDGVIHGCPPTPTELLRGVLWLFNGRAITNTEPVSALP